MCIWPFHLILFCILTKVIYYITYIPLYKNMAGANKLHQQGWSFEGNLLRMAGVNKIVLFML